MHIHPLQNTHSDDSNGGDLAVEPIALFGDCLQVVRKNRDQFDTIDRTEQLGEAEETIAAILGGMIYVQYIQITGATPVVFCFRENDHV